MARRSVVEDEVCGRREMRGGKFLTVSKASRIRPRCAKIFVFHGVIAVDANGRVGPHD